jgi:hypothetical protein
MATITINDLPASYTLDRKALANIRGAGAEWVYGWITPFVEASSRGGQAPVINFFQINNFADQMINQFQTISVLNTGANSALDVKVDESSVNNRII